VRGALGDRARDPRFMSDPAHAQEIGQLREAFGAEFDAEHAARTAQTVKNLQDQVRTEEMLAAVRKGGAEAIRGAHLIRQVQMMKERGATLDEIAFQLKLQGLRRENEATN